MKRKKRGLVVMGQPGWMCTLLICYLCGAVFATVGAYSVKTKAHVKDPRAFGGNNDQPSDHQWTMDNPFFNQLGQDVDILPGRHLLFESENTTEAPREDKSIWEEIEDFYANDNNMAMYCVLPLIVLVYGGCSTIYCVYKCRRYLRRRGKHKKLRNEETSSMSGDEKNDLNQGDSDNQPVKTISGGNSWDESNAAYNVQRKKTPLPWDTPQKANNQSRDGNYSAGSRESTSMALEREREKLDRTLENKSSTDTVVQDPPPPSHQQPPKPRHPPRPIEIVPISQKEYQRHMEANGGALWDPLHNRPFDSRASSAAGGGGGADTERSRNGRESSWSIRDEIMAKYDALTSLAMAKKTAGVLRSGADGPGGGGGDPNLDDMGHRPDTLKRKPGKKKLIFIAE